MIRPVRVGARCAAAFVLVSAACSSANAETPGGAEPSDGLRPFSFAVIGEEPFGAAAEPAVTDLLSSIDASAVAFTINLGDIKAREEPCTDALFEARQALFATAKKPLVVLPGFNDWVACGQGAAPSYDPLERLSRLRELFDGADNSLGEQPIALARQSDMRRFRDYAENVRWEYGHVLFVGLNVPGVNNDFRFAAGRNGEFEDRAVANRAWLERAFRIAESKKLPAIVIAVQGDPEFQRPLRAPDRRLNHRDGFYEFKMLLRELTEHFRGEVLLVHGGVNGSRGDLPLQDAQGKPLRNFVRIESFGSPNTSHWLRVDVDGRRLRVFVVHAEDVVPGTAAPAAPALPNSESRQREPAEE